MKFYLAVLAIASGLPMLVFAVFLLTEVQTGERERWEALVVNRVHQIRASLDRELENAIQILTVLARSHALRERDYAAFHEEARLAATRAGGHILLLDPTNFGQILNTLAPYGTPLPTTSAPETAHQTVISKRPQVSHLFMGNVSKRWVFDVALPVLSDEHVESVLIFSFAAERLRGILESKSLPFGWIAFVTDGADRVVARSEDHERFVGMTTTYAAISVAEAVPAVDDVGVKGLLAMSPSQLSNWKAYVWVDEVTFSEPFRKTWIWLLAMGTSLLALAAILALYAAAWIQRPIDDLASAAAAMARGIVPKPRRTTLREASNVQNSLAKAAGQISEVRETEARLATVTLASGEAIYSLTPEGMIESWNPAAEKLFGYSSEEAVGQPVSILVPPDLLDERKHAIDMVSVCERVTLEAMRRRKDGQCFHAAITLAAIRDGNDDIVGFVSVARDITERKAREQQVELLIRELSHRTKNLLAVVQSLARLTAQNCATLETFQLRFGARLQAYAMTHDALVSRDWQGAHVQDIVKLQLQPLLFKVEGRCTVKGPPLMVNLGAAETLGLAMHELATNALKYGALSNETGRIHIVWSVVHTPAGQVFRMQWTEAGGPLVRAPASRGFGYLVIKDMVEQRMEGHVTLVFAAEGLRWSVESPLALLVAAPAGE